MGLNSQAFDMLSSIRRSLGEVIAAPSIVLDELAAQKAIEHQKAHAAAEKTLSDLAKVTPWDAPAALPPIDLARVRKHWRDRYGQVVNELPVSAEALRQAMFREMNQIAPCRLSKGLKVGARDAAIWLSAIEVARQVPTECVFFVSSNTQDFGTAEQRDSALDDDVREFGSRFVQLTSLDDVFTQFTRPVDIQPDEYQRVLSAPLVTDLEATRCLLDSFRQGVSIIGVENGLPYFSVGIAASIRPAFAEFLGYEDEAAHESDDDIWATATVRYLIGGLFRTDQGLVVGAALWTARIVVSLTDEVPEPTALRTISLTAPGAADVDTVPADIFEDWLREQDWMRRTQRIRTYPDHPVALPTQSQATVAERDLMRLVKAHEWTSQYFDNQPPLND